MLASHQLVSMALWVVAIVFGGILITGAIIFTDKIRQQKLELAAARTTINAMQTEKDTLDDRVKKTRNLREAYYKKCVFPSMVELLKLIATKPTPPTTQADKLLYQLVALVDDEELMRDVACWFGTHPFKLDEQDTNTFTVQFNANETESGWWVLTMIWQGLRVPRIVIVAK